MHTKTIVPSIIICLLFITSLANANEVTLPYKGLTLNASLDLADDKSLADGVILITHGGLAHRDMETIAYFRSLFKAQGYNTLAINLGLGVTNRHDMYDCKITHRHRHTDAADEIGAWVGWLQKQGVKKLALFGHSRGSSQTALYAAEQNNPLVKAVLLLAPDTPESSNATSYQQRYNKPLDPILLKAQNLIKNGKSETVLKHTDFLYCADTSVTADSFVDYYLPSPRRNTVQLIKKIHAPTLIVIAGDDEVVVNNQQFATLTESKNLKRIEIESAGHFFRDLHADDAADAINAFLKEIGY